MIVTRQVFARELVQHRDPNGRRGHRPGGVVADWLEGTEDLATPSQGETTSSSLAAAATAVGQQPLLSTESTPVERLGTAGPAGAPGLAGEQGIERARPTGLVG